MFTLQFKFVAAWLLPLCLFGTIAALSVARPPPPRLEGAPAKEKPQAARRAWEYRVLARPDVERLAPKGAAEQLVGGLNVLGEEGWELAALEPGTEPLLPAGPGRPGGSKPALYIFKRPK